MNAPWEPNLVRYHPKTLLALGAASWMALYWTLIRLSEALLVGYVFNAVL